jgi:F-type H+-transporting ATPase subunit a
VIPVLADLLPNVNELFEYDGIFGQARVVRVQQDALMAMISTLICVGIFLVGSRKRAMVPAGLQNVAEMGYETVEQQIAVQVMGPDDGKSWTPFLATLFFWIFFINIWSTVPFVYFPATSRIAIPLYLALQTWIIFIVVGFKHQACTTSATSCLQGVPFALLFLVVPIEILSKYFIRPFSLAVRLFANMAAGHVLLAVFCIMTSELIVEHNSGIWQIPLGILPFARSIAMTSVRVPRRGAPGVHLHDPHGGVRQRIRSTRSTEPHKPAPLRTHHRERTTENAPPKPATKERSVNEFVSLAVTQADALKSGLGRSDTASPPSAPASASGTWSASPCRPWPVSPRWPATCGPRWFLGIAFAEALALIVSSSSSFDPPAPRAGSVDGAHRPVKEGRAMRIRRLLAAALLAERWLFVLAQPAKVPTRRSRRTRS